MKDKIVEILIFGLQQSTALAFLILGAIFVIFSIQYGEEQFILLSLFIFFYAFIAYRIRVISKKEVWGDYAVGNNWGAGLYFLIDWLLFIGWIAGSIFLLTDYLENYRSVFLWTMVISFGLALAFFVAWIIKMFYTKHKIEKINCEQPNETKCYEVECCCKNCDLERKVKIPRRIRVIDFPCPECKVGGVLRKKKECKD